MKVTVKSGQTLADIAVQEFGSLLAVMDLASANGMAATDTLVAGSELTLPEKTYDKAMASHCKDHGVSPATARDESGLRLRLFTEEFTIEYR